MISIRNHLIRNKLYRERIFRINDIGQSQYDLIQLDYAICTLLLLFVCILIFDIVELCYSPLQQVIDLQLPEQEFVAVKLPNTKEKEHTFKEKVIGNLDDAVSKNESAEMVSFKKSKFKNSNRRKRLDDDWWPQGVSPDSLFVRRATHHLVVSEPAVMDRAFQTVHDYVLEV